MALSESRDACSRNQIVLLMNSIVKGAGVAATPRDTFEATAVMLLELYTSSDMWNWSTSTQAVILSRNCMISHSGNDGDVPPAESELSLRLYKQQVVGVCLLLDGIAVLAQVRHPDV